MKKKSYFLLVCLLLGCQDDKIEETPVLSTDVTAINFAAEGGSKKLQIISNADWSIDCPNRWQVSRTKGNGDAEIIVTAQKNLLPESLEGVLTITAEGLTPVTVTVLQNGTGILPLITFPDIPEGGLTSDVRQWIRIRAEVTNAESGTFKWTVNGEEISTEKNLLHVMRTPGNYIFRLTAKNTYGESVAEVPVTVNAKTYDYNVTQVLEYLPAPGQFVNEMPMWVAGDTQEDMNTKALAAIRNGAISMGGFGGYVIMGFDHVLLNTPDAYDFQIKGNAMDTWSEPGVVMVSVDVNGNGLPDDEWYEIAGSAYNAPETVKDYQITYTLAQAEPMLITWVDNRGANGEIQKTPPHSQNHFPEWLGTNSYTLKGTLLSNNRVYDTSGNGTYWVSMPFGYGYVDNCLNNLDCSKTKLDWAVDKDGNPVKLKGIDFIKVHTGINSIAGWLGEVSTEIYGFEEYNLD